MPIKMDPDCLLCYLKRNLDLVRPLGSEEQAAAFARDLVSLWLSAPEDAASPWMSPGTADLLNKHYRLPIDRFKAEKEAANRFVLERMEDIRSLAFSAPDPVYAGLQLAVLGNYLDFNALQGQVSFEKLDKMLKNALEMDLDRQVYARFCADLQKGRSLLILTDNAGEIGFDRIAAEAIAAKYPHVEITFCVRGDIAANDATRADARTVGIPFRVIDSGSRVAGTQLDQLGAEAKAALDSSDVILAKGMANTETLFGRGYTIYYAFLVKCPKFVKLFQKPMLTPLLLRDPDSL